MWYRVAMVAAAAVFLSQVGAVAAEQATYEILGFPISQHQLAAVNSALVQERSATPTLMLNGMPASPLQVLVLSPRSKQEVRSQRRAGHQLTF
jgi:hypothetical protein